MTTRFDHSLFIRNARLQDRGGLWRVEILGNKFGAIETEDDSSHFKTSWDAKGRLLSSAFVDPHLHLDKCLTSHRASGGAQSLTQAIQKIRTIKSDFTVKDIQQRATQAMQMGLEHGTLFVRTNCEVDTHVEFRALQALQELKDNSSNPVQMQLIAFPQEGWFDSPHSLENGAGEYVKAALTKGMKIIGGNVNQSLWPSKATDQVDEIFKLAQLHDCDIDMHLDNADDESAFTLPYVAQKTIECGWQGRVAVSHIASLSCVSNSIAAQTIDLVKKANISVCVLPTRIRLTRVNELMEAGVNIALGTDNLRDPFVRFGDADPLKVILLLAQLTRQLDDASLIKLWQMATFNAAKMMRIKYEGIVCGAQANFLVIDAPSVPLAILEQSNRLAIFHNGLQVAGQTTIFSHQRQYQ